MRWIIASVMLLFFVILFVIIWVILYWDDLQSQTTPSPSNVTPIQKLTQETRIIAKKEYKKPSILTYVINCDAHKERWAVIQPQLAREGDSNSRGSCVYAKNWTT